jgi:glycerol-3-phosphate dehydrogenase
MRIERPTHRLSDHYDLVVVGAGITGVMVAREAAWRGLRTLVVDQGDFGAGTSAATTKYLHGGIRYLETYEFGVVRESLRERRILALSAPHLVRQTRFLMPAWRWSKPPAALIGAGVGLYTALAWDRNREAPPSLRIPPPRWLSRRRVLEAVPWLNPDQLQGAFAYHDTLNLHPERLLLAFVGSAVQAGAVALNHMAAVGFITEAEATGGLRVRGVEVHDRLNGQRHMVSASAVVNAAGPWMDVVLERLGVPMGVRVNRSRGVHLLTRPLGGRGVVRDAVFARAPNGRHVIVSPWMDRSFIGPTDTPDPAHPDEVHALGVDVDELLDTVNSTVGPHQERLSRDDVDAVTVGIRPLIVQEGRDSYHTSRRHELYDHAASGVHGLWSIGGGKWTTARSLGEEVLDALVRSPMLVEVAPARRARPTRRLTAADAFGWASDATPFLEALTTGPGPTALRRHQREHLGRLYGTAAVEVMSLVGTDPALAAPLSTQPDRVDLAAQVVHAITGEAACTLADVIDRRLVLGTLGRVTPDEIAAVARVAGPWWGWSSDRIAHEVSLEVDRRRQIEARWNPRGSVEAHGPRRH